MRTVVLLTISNLFMTVAWYGHLKFTKTALWLVVLVSWVIAFVEYCFQVPANRIGYLEGWSASQLKIVQEIISLSVFCLFAIFVLGERMKWNYWLGMGLVLAAVFVVRHEW